MLFGTAATHNLEVAARPQTAPSGGRQTAARRHYHEDSIRHQDVLRYRHSGGICPDEYKVCLVKAPHEARQLISSHTRWLSFTHPVSTLTYSTVHIQPLQFAPDTREHGAPLEPKPQGSAKDVFFDARSSYSLNRVRALTSASYF